MPKPYYEPIKLSRTNRYPGYQFHANIRVDGMDEFAAIRFLILTVYKWLLNKLPPEDQSAKELQMPKPEMCREIAPEAFQSYHFNIGYALDITSLLYEGIWSMRLKEPDIGTDERQPVAGRFFTTRIGIYLNKKGFVELGILIDVTDPASEEKEIDFAFRPGFVRSLAIQPEVSFEHVRELRYGNPDQIRTDGDYKRLLFMLDNEDNQLPLVVFTRARPEVKKPEQEINMEDLIKSMETDSVLRFSTFRPADKSLDFALTLPITASAGKKQELWIKPEKTENAMKEEKTGKTTAPVKLESSETQEPPFLPYDTDKFSKSAFAYARTYVLGDRYRERFANRIRKEFLPGDILLCGARKFRGGVNIIRYPGKNEENLKKTYSDALLAAQSYSKHKAPYTFGNVVFEAEARRMEQHHQYRKIVESTKTGEQEKINQLMYQMDLLFDAIANKDEDIRQLNEQANENYNRGLEYAEKEYAELEEENAELKRELAEKQEQIQQMIASYKQAKTILDMVEPMQKTETLPTTNADVVRYFCRVFANRIGFTAQGASSAAKCAISPANLWEIFYNIAVKLTGVFREKQENLTEEDVMKATGFEMSFREGSMTREQKEYMELRKDVYDGKEISIEPHIKLRAGKGELAHQRLHFCYVRDLRKIVIGYVGDHLDSAASRRVK